MDLVRAAAVPGSTSLKVLHVAAEVFPLVKTGGLADVVAALPPALADAGADVRLLLPGLCRYRCEIWVIGSCRDTG